MEESRIAGRIERLQPTCKRSRGQQKQRWKDAAIGKVRLREARARKLSEDRFLWKQFHEKKERIDDKDGTRIN